MSLFAVGSGEPPPILSEGRVVLRLPTVADYQAWVQERADSIDFLKPWEPRWPSDDLTRLAFKRRIKRYWRDWRDRSGYAFFILREADDALIGGVTLSNVRRGVAQCCTLGYWTARRHAGQGYMTEAVQAVLRFSFDELRLHRMEAACIPDNTRSLRLLERAGFEREGFARSYLLIDDVWRDHVLLSRINPRHATD